MINAQPINSQSSHEYWQTIESANFMLAETISIATDDFLSMCTLLKKCNVKSDVLAEEISAAVRELQHIDFLRQKLGHVCDMHLDLQNNDAKIIGVDEDNKYAGHGLIFRVNYFQLMAAHEDYIKVVLSVQSTIRKIKEHNVLLISFNTPIFPNRFRIDDNFRTLNTSLGSLADKYYYQSDTNLSQLIDKISSKYTMESERVVLQWCLGNPNSTSEDNFMDHYKATSVTENIELF
jgi:hypothetical protein